MRGITAQDAGQGSELPYQGPEVTDLLVTADGPPAVLCRLSAILALAEPGSAQPGSWPAAYGVTTIEVANFRRRLGCHSRTRHPSRRLRSGPPRRRSRSGALTLVRISQHNGWFEEGGTYPRSADPRASNS